MWVPKGAVLSVTSVEFKGLLRPKHFFVVRCSDEKGELSVERYVRSWPFLLRVRLALHCRRAVLAFVKAKAFKARHKV